MPDQLQAIERYPNRYRPGESGNPAGRPSEVQRRALVDAKAHELALELGGFDALTAIEKTLITRAAELNVGKPRRYDERIRVANITARIIRDILARHKPAKAKPAGLHEYLATARGTP
jgi:hypothetical protein